MRTESESSVISLDLTQQDNRNDPWMYSRAIPAAGRDRPDPSHWIPSMGRVTLEKALHFEQRWSAVTFLS